MSTLPQDPQSFRKAFTYRRRRAFFSFRRRSDFFWFGINICLFVFSITILVYKVKFEPPSVVEKVIERQEIQQIPVPTATWPAEPAAPMPEGGTIQRTPAPPEPAAVAPEKKPEVKPPPKETKKVEKKKEPAPKVETQKSPSSLPYKAADGPAWDFLGQNWRTLGDKDAAITMLDVETDAGKSVKLTYHLSKGQWVQIYQDAQIDLSAYKKVRLSYFLAEGKPAAVEFKIEDDAGAVNTFPLDRTVDGQWRQKDIAIAPQAKAKALDWKKIRRLYVIISGKTSDKNPNTKGTLWINELKAQ